MRPSSSNTWDRQREPCGHRFVRGLRTRPQLRQGYGLAKDAGYERPFACFDDIEHKAIRSAAAELNLIPRVVAGVLPTDRFTRFVAMPVTSRSSATRNRNEGIYRRTSRCEGGETVKCQAHIQIADVDPGLKKPCDLPQT